MKTSVQIGHSGNASLAGRRMRLFGIASFLLFLVGGLVLWIFQTDELRDSDDVLATVGDQIITTDQFAHACGQYSERDSPKIRERVLAELVERAVLVQRARELGLDRDPALIADMQRLLVAKLREHELDPKLAALEIPGEELRAYYDQIAPDRYGKPEQRRVAVLWFDHRGAAELEQRYKAKLEVARTQFLQSETPVDKGFGNLAMSNTEHRSSRFKGGVIGFIQGEGNSDPWRAGIWKLAAELKEPGAISPVTTTDAGVFLVRLLQIQPARVLPFETVVDEVRRELRSQRTKKIESDFEQAARSGISIEIHDKKLQSIDLPIANSSHP